VKAIVIRQPWAWLIVHGYKDIENRSWRTHYRGPLLIQASASLPPKAELEELKAYAKKRGAVVPDELETGGVVGIATLADCVERSRSRWFEGDFGWVLQDARPTKFVAMKGQLGLFDPPRQVLRALGF
jgi:hypothetical protein